MIELKTNCAECKHRRVCKYEDNAKSDMEKLKGTIYGDGPNDDYDWDTMSGVNHVTIEFSCKDFEKIGGGNWR